MIDYWEDEFTDESAASYMATYGEGPGSETRITLASFIKPGESVLDVGCGPGWNYDHFKEFGPKVTYLGTDKSKRFVRVANERNPGHYTVGDIRNIDVPDKSWNVVVMQDVLEHNNGYKKPLEEALRVANKRVIVTFWRMGTEDKTNDDGDDTWGSVYSRENWEKYLDALDLKWTLTQINPEGRIRDFYVIDVSDGKS